MSNLDILVPILYKRAKLFQIYLRESTIIPDITMVRETIADIPKFTFFHILFYWIKQFFFGNLIKSTKKHYSQFQLLLSNFFETHLHFSICPPRNFHDKIQNGLVLIRKQGNIMPRRNYLAISF